MAKKPAKESKYILRAAGGYQKQWPFLNRLIDIFYAYIILFFASPLILIFSILIKLQDCGPVFYKGKRMGKGKKTYFMYKLRTLRVDAEKIIGGQLLTSQHRLETPIGKFLRDTRVDEIPQLFNVIRGDMDFIGPRPERWKVYEEQCKNIKGYDPLVFSFPGTLEMKLFQ